MSKNKIILVGNVTKDPQLYEFENGKLCTFGIATTDKGYKTKEGKDIPEKTEFHNIVCSGRLVDVCLNHVKKGAKLYVEGKLKYKQYTDKDGGKRIAANIHLEDLEFCQSKPKQSYPDQQGQQEEDLPF